jgi:hypothetical protein
MKYIVNKQLRQERMIGRRQQSYNILFLLQYIANLTLNHKKIKAIKQKIMLK